MIAPLIFSAVKRAIDRPYGSYTKNSKVLKPLNADIFEKEVKDENPVQLKRGQVLGNDNKVFTRSDTSMFRWDINWNEFGKYLEDRFSSDKKVNTYIYACSKGLEAYSLSILLQNKFEKDASKFFPVIAKDIDKNIIENNIKAQKNGEIEVDPDACEVIFTFKDGCTEEENYRRADKYIAVYLDKYAVEHANLREAAISDIEFSCANILEDLDNIDNKNPSIVMCRNMWPYVDNKEYEDFANKLYKRLAPGSIVVIGSFFDYMGDYKVENSGEFPAALRQAGFETYENSELSKRIGDSHPVIFEKN